MWKIHGISEELMIAAGNEDGFYVYAADESTAPDTLGKLLELFGLSQNIELNYVTDDLSCCFFSNEIAVFIV